MRFFALLACFLVSNFAAVVGQTSIDALLKRLNQTIDSTAYFDARKFEAIANIKTAFDQSPDKSLAATYHYHLQLYEQYKIFKFDTAFKHAQKLEELALSLNDPYRIAEARIKLSFVLISAGMYGEADNIMKGIDARDLPDSLRASYYLTRGRYYYDVADYDNDDFFYPIYFKKAGAYLDSALAIYPSSSFEHLYYSGLKQMKAGDMNNAFGNFQQLLTRPGLSEHEFAIVASTQSFIYHLRGQKDTAISYQIMAAIADIRSSTKETFAVLNLAQILFGQGDFKRASFYIKKSIDDATSYGARQRKVQLSTIMPIIQSSEINYIERQRRMWIVYGAIVSAIVILFAWLLFVIFRQNKRLEKARQQIADAHTQLSAVNNRLEHLNTELHNVNNDLVDLNGQLEEANKIKDEYVGYFFTTNAGLFRKIEKFKSAIEEKIHYGKTNELKYVLAGMDVKSEEAELLKSFDKAFLKLFPHFVEDFNALFDDDNKVRLQEGELLNTELRIYALLRLGIKENEKIAEILEYSVKSIYAYKTKVRNRSMIPRDEFDKRVMEIKSVQARGNA